MDTRAKILEILTEICPGIDFETEDALIDDELIESLDIVTIVSELVDSFDITINVNDLLPENFNNLDAITALVESRLD